MKSEDTIVAQWTNLDFNRIGMTGMDPNAANTQISFNVICALRRPSTIKPKDYKKDVTNHMVFTRGKCMCCHPHTK